jgi:hypothetical protein
LSGIEEQRTIVADARTPSHFPSIEKKAGARPAEWQQIIANCGVEKHMAIVGYLKSQYGMGHGHASALVAGRSPGASPARELS